MKKFVLLLAFAVAFSLAGFAQAGTESSQGTQGTESQSTTKAHKGKHAAGTETGAAASTKGAHLTGCIAKDASGSGYMLTNGRYKKGVEVKSSEDLSAHVGHEVKLTGSWEKPTSGEAGGAGAKGETMRTFNATNVQHVSDTCKAGGSAAKKSKKGAGSSAAAPSGL